MSRQYSVHIDSSDKTSGTNEDFSITLDSELKNIKRVEVTDIIIPNTMYAVNSTNNTITFLGPGPGFTSYDAVVDPGNYENPTTLITEMKAKMIAQLAGFDIDFSATTGKFTFTNSANDFDLQLSSTISNTIGLSANSGNITAGGAGFVCQNIANLSGINNIHVKSDALVQYSMNKPKVNDSSENLLLRLPVIGAKYTYLSKIDMIGKYVLRYTEAQTFSSIDLELSDKDNNVLDLNGDNLSWSISLIFYTN